MQGFARSVHGCLLPRPVGVRAASQRLPRGQVVDHLLLCGSRGCREIPGQIWRRTIRSEGPRPWLKLGAVVQDRTLSAYIAGMCGRFTRNYTWEQIHALYRLTAPAAIPNLQPRFNA